MKVLLFVIAIPFVLVGMIYSYWVLTAKVASGTWRYEITVEIETPEGLKSGSAVREIRAFARPALWGEGSAWHLSHEVIGEAVVVDLGERGVLFALIDWDSYREVYNAFPYTPKSPVDRVKHYRSLEVGLEAQLKKNLPWFATFKSNEDPLSLSGVNREKLNEFFGQGVSFLKVKIKTTEQPITTNSVEQYLPPNYLKMVLEGWSALPKETRTRLSGLNKFKRGESL